MGSETWRVASRQGVSWSLSLEEGVVLKITETRKAYREGTLLMTRTAGQAQGQSVDLKSQLPGCHHILSDLCGESDLAGSV